MPTHTHTDTQSVTLKLWIHCMLMMVWHGIEWNGIYSQRKSSDSIYIFNAFIKFILTTRVWAFSFGFSVLGVRFISSHSSSSDIYAHKIIIMTIGQFIEMMNSHLLFEGVRAFVCVCFLSTHSTLFMIWRGQMVEAVFIVSQFHLYSTWHLHNQRTNQPTEQTNKWTNAAKKQRCTSNESLRACLHHVEIHEHK